MKLTAGNRFSRIAQPVSATAPDEVVSITQLFPDHDYPLLVRPRMNNIDLAMWCAANKPFVLSKMHEAGALLFRDFNVSSLSEFERIVIALSDQMLKYKERSSPRTEISEHVYTSTEYPADQEIFFHNENSYQLTFPSLLGFFCASAPATGGETPLADCRRVLRQLDEDVRRQFIIKKWMYVRNLSSGLGLPWQTVFQTQDPAMVEHQCRQADIGFEWRPGGGLRISAIRDSVLQHPKTAELVWFNHSAFFHVTTLPVSIRNVLTSQISETDLPSNTFFGDGTPISGEIVNYIRECYRAESVSFTWRRSDILIVDNLILAHARAPFTGDRRVMVAMANPAGWRELAYSPNSDARGAL